MSSGVIFFGFAIVLLQKSPYRLAMLADVADHEKRYRDSLRA